MTVKGVSVGIGVLFVITLNVGIEVILVYLE